MKQVLFIISLVFIIVACSQNHKSDNTPYIKNENGLVYKYLFKSNSNIKPKVGDAVLVEFAVYSPTDSLLETSANTTDSMIMVLQQPRDTIPSLDNALAMMEEGDSMSFKINAITYFMLYRQVDLMKGKYTSTDSIRIELKMQKIFDPVELAKRVTAKYNALKEQEHLLLVDYIEKNHPGLEPNVAGMYIIPYDEGKGELPHPRTQVVVHLVVSFINGQPYFSSRLMNEPLTFSLFNNDLPRGLNQAILSMRKGAVSKLIIPSHLAYGKDGNKDIPPFTTLVMEVELIDFKS